MSGVRQWWRRRLALRTESGVVAVMIAILLPTVFVGLAAIAVDMAQWSLEKERLQKAADAAVLAGVPFLPQNFSGAADRAREVAAINGYDDTDDDVDITVGVGDKPSELTVEISSRVTHSFGAALGVRSAVISAFAMADFQGSVPMGSPCNAFGNEPSAGGGSASPTPTGSAMGSPLPANCTSNPQFWATIHGPGIDKEQGDRFQDYKCVTSTKTDGCAGGVNAEYDPLGYFFVVNVREAAVGTPITVQLYDPAYVYTNNNCNQLPASSDFTANMNPFVGSDAPDRYSKSTAKSSTGSPYCPGDFPPGLTNKNLQQMTTTFLMREQTDSENPRIAKVISGCTKQYTGLTTAPTATMLAEKKTVTSGGKKGGTTTVANPDYNPELAQVFHNWDTLCTFTPARKGDYYIQVRSGISTVGGSTSGTNNSKTHIIYTGNPNASSPTTNTTQGEGANSFAIRAVTQAGLQRQVAVSAFERMPIYANADSATSTFNLLRVLPGAAGQYIAFTFFDVGDVSSGSGGTVRVIPPSDATGSIKTNPFPGKCRSEGGAAGASGMTLTNCSAPISNTTNNGVTQKIIIPIPSDYNCSFSVSTGCWYAVEVHFPSASVTDATTWTASVIGDPVRLIK